MAQNDTAEKILHAATLLFSERGFSETSLRTITGMAEVNVAAVNYHFGSKKELIQAVFARFLLPISKKLEMSLDELEARNGLGAIDSEQLLKLLFDVIIDVSSEIGDDPQRFMRLLGLAYSQTQEHLRHFIVNQFGDTYHRVITLLDNTLPGLTPVEFYWRLYFMMGAAVFTLSSFDAIRSILNADYKQDTTMAEVVELMVPAMGRLLGSSHAK